MTEPISRYDFVRQSDGAWTWQRTNPDGSTTPLSTRHKTMGAIVASALARGFRPSVDHWIIDNFDTVTYFEAGSPPKTLNKSDSSPDAGCETVPAGLP